MRTTVVLMAAIVLHATVQAQDDIVTYAGGEGNERFYCGLQLSDNTLLVGGAADDLDWLPSDVPVVELNSEDARGTAVPAADPADDLQGAVSFLLHLSADGTTIHTAYRFPAGAGGAIRDIKTSSMPGVATGDLYLGGLWTNTGHSTPPHCWVGKLDRNVVDGSPSGLTWIWTDIMNGGGDRFRQNWDVGGDGKVVYSSYKDPSAGAWHAVYRLKADGSVRDTVPNWWDHSPWCVSLKPGNNDMRSLTQADYDRVTSHSGQSKKKGAYPHDFYFAGPSGIDDNAGGYTGYRSDGKTATTAAIAVDRRDNTMYIGFNTPVANNTHDFEPTVMMMRPDGEIAWYSHLYDEWTDDNNDGIVDDGETHQSPPDHYVDGVAVDYTAPTTAPEIVVLARSHGNAPENLWSGTGSFHNQFTGTNGNEHLSWLGRFAGDDGTFVNASWLAEYDPWGDNFGAAYTDPILDGWPDHNRGWADLKTTRGHDLVVDLAGQPCVLANSRGPVTTSNAFQKAARPTDGLAGCWSDFVRVHTSDFSSLTYSSILSGPCDSTTGGGGGNIVLHALVPLATGVLVAGYHPLDGDLPKGDPMPVVSVPDWGATAPQGESAVLALLQFDQEPFAVRRGVPAARAGVPVARWVGDMLTVTGLIGQTRLTVFDMSGRRVAARTLTETSAAWHLPCMAGGTCILSLSGDTRDLVMQVPVVR